MLDHRSAACVGAMAGIYRRVLTRIEADPGSVLRDRVSLPAWEKALVAARSLAGVGA
jgi:phytoene synthase